MLSLEDPRWSTIDDAYGPALRVPGLLRDLEKLPPAKEMYAEPYRSLWSALCHQGDVYPASYAAVPHLLRIVEESGAKFEPNILRLVHSIIVGRAEGSAAPMPDDLKDAYEKALASVPKVASKLLLEKLSISQLGALYGACVSAMGHPMVAEALFELTPEIARKILKPWRFATEGSDQEGKDNESVQK